MTNRPPSPSAPSPPIAASSLDGNADDGLVVTTTQLAASIRESFDCAVDENTLEEILLELDQADYVEWVSITREGTYVWDLSDSPEKIADTIAAAVAERIRSWV
ncbi:hypothetical protein ACLI4Z_18860 [Natrialbaceae archaeon A-arb3/5]